MWALLPSKVQLTIILFAGIMVWNIWNLTASMMGTEPPSLLKIASFSVTVIGTLLVLLFNFGWRWIWRKFPVLERSLAPDLNGEWRGTVKSTWIDPDTKLPRPPIRAKFKIEQSLLRICISMQTNESSSESGRAFLEQSGRRGSYRLWYTYHFVPHARVQHRSPPHDGVAFLHVDVGGDRDSLKGYYFTSRRTTGDINLKRVRLNSSNG